MEVGAAGRAGRQQDAGGREGVSTQTRCNALGIGRHTNYTKCLVVYMLGNSIKQVFYTAGS